MTGTEQAIRVSEAGDDDSIEQVRLLFREYAAEFAGSIAESLCFRGFEAELTSLPGRYGPPTGCVLLATDGNHVAGCVAMRDLGDGVCEMKRLFVVPGYRGQGVGRRLVEEVINRAGRLGYRRMVLDTLPEMVGAIALYHRFGFVEIDRYWDNPIERTIYMERALNMDGSDNFR